MNQSYLMLKLYFYGLHIACHILEIAFWFYNEKNQE